MAGRRVHKSTGAPWRCGRGPGAAPEPWCRRRGFCRWQRRDAGSPRPADRAARPPVLASRTRSKGRASCLRVHKSRTDDRSPSDRDICSPADALASGRRASASCRRRAFRATRWHWRRGRLGDRVARAAGKFRADMPDDAKMSWHVIERLADIFAQMFHRAATVRAGAGTVIGGLDHNVFAPQMLGPKVCALVWIAWRRHFARRILC